MRADFSKVRNATAAEAPTVDDLVAAVARAEEAHRPRYCRTHGANTVACGCDPATVVDVTTQAAS